MKNKFLLVFICIILVTSLTTAATFDNKKEPIKYGDGISEYGKIEIRDWFGILKLSEIELKTNTEKCSINQCEASNEITMYQDGILIDDVRFKEYKKGQWVNGNIKNYYFEYLKDGKWIRYNYEEVQGSSKGIVYQVRLKGELYPFQIADWQVKTQGIWIEDWAIWTSSLSNGVTSYYKFNETAGDLIDIASGKFNGTIIDITTRRILSGSPAGINYGYKFDGTNDVINVTNSTPNSPFGGNEGTVSLWFNASFSSGSADLRSLLSADIDYILLHNSDGNFRFYTGGVLRINTPSAGWWNANDWTHMIATWNTTTTRIYINGTQKANGAGGAGSNPKEMHIGNQIGQSRYWKGVISELGLWGRVLDNDEITQLYNGGIGISYEDNMKLNVTLNSPTNDSTSTTGGTTTFNASIEPILSNITNATIYVWNSTNDIINKTTNSFWGNVSNSTTWGIMFDTTGTYHWNVLGCVINTTDSRCKYAYANRTLIVADFQENAINYNATTYETAIETFNLNITTNGSTPTSAKLIYNGTSYTGATITNEAGNNYIISKQINIELLNGTKSFFFNFTMGSEQSSATQTQEVGNIFFTICNSTNNIPYINYTFKNETTSQEQVNATIVSSFTYWLGDGGVNKTLTYSNATENYNYTFCFSPGDRSIGTLRDVSYNNGESQQRSLTESSTISSTTTEKVLYLLPTALGLFAQFRTEDSLGNTLANVKGTITRTLGTSTITTNIDYTDDSGLLVTFLDPDITYSATFSLSGYDDNTFSFVPVTDTRTVIMGGTSTTTVNATVIGVNTTYVIEPKNSTLRNNTDVVWKFNVTSGETITSISMNITNETGSQILYVSNVGQGFISGTNNTGNQTRLIGVFTIQTSEETLTFVKIWVVGNEFVGDYSLYRQLTLFLTFGFSDFIRLFIVIALIAAMVIFMSAGEITDTGESKIAAIIVLVWIFSFLGWLDNPAVVATTGIAEFSKQYGIAILTTMGGLFFLLRRVFISRV